MTGGAVIDMIGEPERELLLHTSNPGRVQQHWGGVGRNIAEALTRLTLHPFFISAVGNDIPGTQLLEYSRSIGMVLFVLQYMLC